MLLTPDCRNQQGDEDRGIPRDPANPHISNSQSEQSQRLQPYQVQLYVVMARGCPCAMTAGPSGHLFAMHGEVIGLGDRGRGPVRA